MIVCKNELLWLRSDTNLIEIETQNKISRRFNSLLNYCSENNEFEWNRNSWEQIVNQTRVLAADSEIYVDIKWKSDQIRYVNLIWFHHEIMIDWNSKEEIVSQDSFFVVIIVFWSVRSLISVDIFTMMIRIKSIYWWCNLLLNEYEILILSTVWSICKMCESRDSH
jgi:hypothetical protein